ncbi:bile acid:sodium symporter family protein [Peribacillus frigoritolerans]|uniref:bile acid:sodium symporter family protein n=1 Tax=Peribacillus frigoritolerans TaxID=450367 RepID=UPI001EFD2CB8|nr:bile acid:sodium symporter family protein [Peribacillus frigoritolerans]ULM99435.1 bile acid:sodium symporter family protein [Peribacillus frigoritolerans]
MKVLKALSAVAGKYFAVWVILISVIAFIFPEPFLGLGGFITILLGVVMFGMGLTLKAVDFKIIITKPLPVIIGVCAQFIIMPSVAFLIAKLMNLPAELAAGLVLLGCVPGGTASNVMVYLAKGNVPLSIAMTSVSTLLAPIMTPLLLLLLAGQWMPVDFFDMFKSIVQVILLPIVLGLAIKRFFPVAVEKSLTVLPLISVAAIITIVSAVVSGNAASIAASGFLIFTAVMLHNGFGLLFGYLAAKVLGLDEVNRRAISIEVGMQNSGLGVALATAHFGPLAALPSVLAAAWHNISGPILATYWSKKHAGDSIEEPRVHPVETKL